jgi:hypothetical protein
VASGWTPASWYACKKPMIPVVLLTTVMLMV